MNRYPWLHPHFRQLIASYQSGLGPPALLIQALPGMGSDALIYAIIRFIMCQQLVERKKSCGRCRGCQLMQAQTHPDYYFIKPDKGKTSLDINVISYINENIYAHARLGGYKVVWLKAAEQLTEMAVIALLKTLEEPPEKTWFFLSCRESYRLLLLRSRCRLHHLSPPDEALAIDWLACAIRTSPEAMLSALRLCGGAPAAALAQLQPEIWSQREQLCNLLSSALESGNWLTLLSVLNHEQSVQRLHWLAALLLDAMKLQHGVGTELLSNPDVWPLLNKLAERIMGNVIQAIIHNVYEARKRILTVSELNRELLLTNLLMWIEYSLQPGVMLSSGAHL